jgi:regulator of RNase E activity RraA
MDYADLLERLQALDTCAVSDALDSMGMPGAVDGLVRRSTRERIAGRVRTMKLAAGLPPASSTTHLGTRSIAEAQDTDVIVVEQRTGVHAACWGGVLSHAAKQRRIRGIVVEGPVRDVDEFSEVGIPVFSRDVTPRTARGRIYEAAINVDVEIGDVAVRPGDLVIADGTGVVFVSAASANAVISLAEKIAAKEVLIPDNAWGSNREITAFG